jgi:hypothetical protein
LALKQTESWISTPQRLCVSTELLSLLRLLLPRAASLLLSTWLDLRIFTMLFFLCCCFFEFQARVKTHPGFTCQKQSSPAFLYLLTSFFISKKKSKPKKSLFFLLKKRTHANMLHPNGRSFDVAYKDTKKGPLLSVFLSKRTINLSVKKARDLIEEVGIHTELTFRQEGFKEDHYELLNPQIVILTVNRSLNGFDISKACEMRESLRVLSLHSCGISKLPLEIVQFSRLKKLELQHNRLTDLPEEMWCLSSLKMLNLSNNLLKKIPDSFIKFEKLVSVILEDNPFEEFPWQFVNCELNDNPLKTSSKFIWEVSFNYKDAARARRDQNEILKCLAQSIPFPIYEEMVEHIEPKSAFSSFLRADPKKRKPRARSVTKRRRTME